jgi:hypothetical protein
MQEKVVNISGHSKLHFFPLKDLAMKINLFLALFDCHFSLMLKCMHEVT